MLAILKRELRSYFSGPLGYILTALMVFVPGLFFVAYCLSLGAPDFSYYVLFFMPTIVLTIIYVPLLAMRSLSEERKNRTDQLLLTSPVKISEIVIGKYLAMAAVFLLPCMVYALMLAVMALLGATAASMAVNFTGLLCYFLQGCAMIAICEFISGLTENMIIAAFAGMASLLISCLLPNISQMFTAGSLIALLLFVLVLLVAALIVGLRTKSLILGGSVFAVGTALLLVLYAMRGTALTAAFTWLLNKLSLIAPYQDILDQTFSIPGIVYYAVVIVLFLFFTCQALEKRRWN